MKRPTGNIPKENLSVPRYQFLSFFEERETLDPMTSYISYNSLHLHNANITYGGMATRYDDNAWAVLSATLLEGWYRIPLNHHDLPKINLRWMMI